MKSAQKISEKLNEYSLRTDELKIKDWMFQVAEGNNIQLGMHNNSIGGPYKSPSVDDVFQGAIYIQWDDKKVSKSVMKFEMLEDIDKAIQQWKTASYNDLDTPDVPEPKEVPLDIKIKDQAVVDIVRKDSSYLFDILNFYNNELKDKPYTKTISGSAGAGQYFVKMLSSKGLNIEWESTTTSTYVMVNDSIYDAYGKRKLATKKDLKDIVKEVDKLMLQSEKEIMLKSGVFPVIFMPDVLGSFFDKYLMGSHLNGEKVSNNKSLFSIDDFKSKKKVFDGRINLEVDGLKDFSSATSPCSGEGVPANKIFLIANGRLITPILDLKYANKLGMESTCFGETDLKINTSPYQNSVIKNIDYGLIVHDILGMHTQDESEGRYSLTVSKGFVIEEGKIVGCTKGPVVAGNFFDHLKDKKTVYPKYRKDEISMKTVTSVTV